jgi:tetratricopeptide (TPR) repeat protein
VLSLRKRPWSPGSSRPASGGRSLPRMATALALAGVLGVPQAAHSGESGQPGEDPAEPEDDDVQRNPQLERAMDAFRRGTTAYAEARYEDALAAFQEAATQYASPDFQYNIGLCYEKLDKPEEAIRAFETYLRTKSDASDRANVEDRIRRLRADAKRAATQQPALPTPEPVVEDQPPPSRPLIIAGASIVAVGAGMALGGGIGFGVVARQRSNALVDIQDGGNPQGSTFADAQNLERDGKRLEVLQVTFVAIGAAVALTGAALMAVGMKRRKRAADSARMQVVPGIARGSTGLSLVGRF